jgi:hypothetical protein
MFTWDNRRFYFFNKKNKKEIFYIFSHFEENLKLKINNEENLTELKFTNKTFLKPRCSFHLDKISLTNKSPEDFKGLKKIESHYFDKPLYLNFKNLKCSNFIIEFSNMEELLVDENSFPENSTIIFTAQCSNYNNLNYKKFIEFFPKINDSLLAIPIPKNNNFEYFFSNIIYDFKNKDCLNYCFLLYTILELLDQNYNIIFWEVPNNYFKFNKRIRKLIENNFSKQQLKDICENFESLQKHSIEF